MYRYEGSVNAIEVPTKSKSPISNCFQNLIITPCSHDLATEGLPLFLDYQIFKWNSMFSFIGC